MCTAATKDLPADTAQPLSEACIATTAELVKIPAEICDTVMKKADELGQGVCKAIADAGQVNLQLTRTALAARKMRARFARAPFMKLDAIADFVEKLKAAIEKAKADLIKIKDEALTKAATIVAETVAGVVKKAIEPVKEALSKAADAAVETAKGVLTKLTENLAKIPTKVAETLGEACKLLPGGAEVVGLCTTGLEKVTVKAKEVLGSLCTKGVATAVDTAKKACTTASSKADELLKSADGNGLSLNSITDF